MVYGRSRETLAEAHSDAGCCVKVQLLGPFQVSRNGDLLDSATWSRRSQRLLTLLAVTPDHRRLRDELIDLLWPEATPEAGGSNLRGAVRELRHALGQDITSPVLTEHGWLLLNPNVDWDVDLDRFRRLLTTGDDIRSLEEALGLVRGEVLAEESYEDWAAHVRHRVDQQWRHGCLRLAELYRAGAPQEAVRWLERLLDRDPLDEAAVQALLGVLAELGQRTEGLRVYQHFAHGLKTELDLEPAEETRAALEYLRTNLGAGVATGHTDDSKKVQPIGYAAVPTQPRRPRHNLPVPPTPLIDRERETKAACLLLRRPEVRLVTLTGTGGTGKTRLALRVANEVLQEFADGVVFVSLASITDYALVPSAVAAELGVREVGAKPVGELLKEHLQEKQMLLVLDNFEHVLEAGAWLADLLAVAPNVRVLTTSRSVLRLYGEHEFPVPTLSVPGPNTPRDPEALSQYHAVTLFIQRAEAVKPEFTVTNDTAPTIAEICYQLDGLPLAIELAAARVRLFPPRSLLDRLTSRLELLTGGGRDLPARHQTLRAAIDWSYSLLDTAEQALFVRLSVFHGGGSLDAVEAICCSGSSLGSDILDGITSLTEKSLLRLEGEEEPRFVMLATIREYAAERLTESGDGERLRRRHAQYYLDLARRAEREFHGPEEKVWLDRIQVEVDNLRAVVQWVKNTGTLEVGQQLVESLYHFWRMRGYLSEVSRWLDGMLRRENIATGMGLTEARLHFLAGMIALDQADWERAAPHFEDALTLFRECDDPQGTAWAGYWVGRIGLWMSNCEPARRLLDESLALVNQHGATWEPRARSVRLYALLGLFEIAHSEHDLERASALYEEAVQFAGNPDEQGSKLGMADQLRVLGHFQREQGNLQSSVSLLEESQTLFQQVGATYESLDNLRSLGWIAQEQGNLERATALYETSLALSRQLGDGRGTAIALLGLADVARNRGDAARVIELCGEALKLSREHRNDPFMSAFSGFALNNLGLAERTLGDFDRARSLLEESRTVLQGAAHQHLTSEPIIGLGWVALDEQEYGRAREFFVESLRLLRGGALSWQVAAGLEGMATVAMAQDKAHTATYMLSTADAIRTQLGMPIWPVNRQRYERVLVAARESLGTDEFDRAWEEGRRMALEEVIEHAVNEAPMW